MAAVDVLDLEVKRCCAGAGGWVFVQREGGRAGGKFEPRIGGVGAVDDQPQAKSAVEGDAFIKVADGEGDLVQVHGHNCDTIAQVRPAADVGRDVPATCIRRMRPRPGPNRRGSSPLR